MKESAEIRYSRITRDYQKKFGELPKILFTCGDGLDLCLDLMEQAIKGKRSRVTEVDFGFPPGADI